jgi:phosphotransferase system HPr (HPr) family protein
MATTLELDIRNPSGLHARPAAVFVRTATGFRSDVRIANLTTGGGPVTAKSILGVLGLGVQRGHRIQLTIAGEDELEATDAIRAAVEGGLDEPLDGAGPA